jgi:hypothetical protein
MISIESSKIFPNIIRSLTDALNAVISVALILKIKEFLRFSIVVLDRDVSRSFSSGENELYEIVQRFEEEKLSFTVLSIVKLSF